TRTVHLSPMRSSVSATAWQLSLWRSSLRTDMCVALKAVPPCEKRPRSYYRVTNKMFVKNQGEASYDQTAHRHRDLDHSDGTLRGQARRVAIEPRFHTQRHGIRNHRPAQVSLALL